MEQVGFGIWNWVAVVSYLVVMLLVGAYFTKRASQSTDSFFTASGRLPSWAVGFSIYATTLSAITFMSTPEKAFLTDWSYIAGNIAIVAIIPLLIYFYVPFFKKLKVTSAYEYLEARFGPSIRVIGSLLFVGNVHDFKMNEDSEQRIRVHPRHTYDSLLNTFKAIQLLVQTVSNTEHGMFQFIPVTHHSTIQQRVKAVYKEIKNADTQYKLIEELNVLFKSIIEKNNTLYIHYYLQGFEESMYTRQQISLIENVSQKRLFELELNDLVMMMFELEEQAKYPILNQLIILPTLLFKTEQTFSGIKNGLSFNQLANMQNVKPNTIEDHILELFIKGYLSKYKDYLNSQHDTSFLRFYIGNRGERLRNYKEKFPELSYFEIKLLIVGFERGDLNVTT